METIKLIFFYESVDIIKPKDFDSLKKEIEKKYLLNPIDVSELIIFYKNPEKNYIQNNDDYQTFYNLNINELYINIKINSQLYLTNLDLIKKENDLKKEGLNQIKIKSKITKIEKPNKEQIIKPKININKLDKGINYHYGVECNNCHLFPIIGCRYKCVICDNLSFCENCEKKIGFIHSHPLIKINSPKYQSMILKIFIRNQGKIH